MTLVLTQGDTGPALTGTVNANLTGATIKVNVKRPDGTTTTKTATSSDPTNGAWAMSWATGDLDLSGDYYVEVEVTFSNTQIQTFASARGGNRIAVRRQIA